MNKRPFALRNLMIGAGLTLAASVGGCMDWYDHSQPIRPAYADARQIYGHVDDADASTTQPAVGAVRDWYDTGTPYTEGGASFDDGTVATQDDGTYSPTYLYSELLPGYQYGYGPLGYGDGFVGASLYDRPSYAYGYYPYGYGYGVYRSPGYALGRYERDRYFTTRAPDVFAHRYPEDFRRYRAVGDDRRRDERTRFRDDDRGLVDRTPRQPMPIPTNPRNRANARDASNADLAAARARIDAARTRAPVIDRSPNGPPSDARAPRNSGPTGSRSTGNARADSQDRSGGARSNDRAPAARDTGDSRSAGRADSSSRDGGARDSGARDSGNTGARGNSGSGNGGSGGASRGSDGARR